MFKIALPNPNEFENNIKGFFAQFRVVLKAAEKSYEEATKGLIDEEQKSAMWLIYRFPEIELNEREQDNEGNVKVHVDEEGDSMQKIELEINEI